jgi:hypothetical protein
MKPKRRKPFIIKASVYILQMQKMGVEPETVSKNPVKSGGLREALPYSTPNSTPTSTYR